MTIFLNKSYKNVDTQNYTLFKKKKLNSCSDVAGGGDAKALLKFEL